MGTITGAHLLIRTLKRHGVRRLFGLCGDHVNAIFNACLDEGITIVDVRQESGATHMADGWARVTGQPGVSVVTGGPGHTNSITGIATAWMACSPIIAISGMHEWGLRDRGPLQEIDQVELVRPITKWARVVTDPARLGQYAAIAYREAVSGRPGPVHLTIPGDVLEAAVDDSRIAIPEPWRHEATAASPDAVDAALDRLQSAERPAIIAGSGIWWARAWEPLQRFVEATALPCFTIGMARGSLSDEHPLCFGYADAVLNPAAREIREADVVLLIGKRIDFRLGYGNLFGPNAHLIQVDIHAAELGRNRNAQLPIQCDAGAFLAQMAAGAEKRGGWKEKPWAERLRAARRAAAESRRPDETSDASPVHPLRIVREVREAVNSDVVWVIDGGDFAQWCRLALPARKPGHWVRLGALGTVGAAIPLGVVAKLAKPDCPVVILTGDGGMAFHSWELHTALRFNAPVVVVVGNDCGWGMERELQAAFYDRTVGVELGPVRYDKVIEGMGGHGEHVEVPAELRPALDRALKSGRVACVNVMMRGVPSPLTTANIARAKGPKV
ncbi:MAG: thiamine pyrophosphate-binding protein [Candidatus Rokubacteria bacterium]|nr:thiamine pyrophosphate-binding protein [Candidatus Rokubacteria bacterium]